MARRFTAEHWHEPAVQLADRLALLRVATLHVQPVRQLHQEHVVRGRREDAAEVAAELEVADVLDA